ncbi:MAG TPA: hypothetical protein VF172_11790 [Nitrososphaera sp.]|jgi:hypothetical protein
MSTKGIAVISLLATLGLLFVIGVIIESPTAMATTTAPQDNITSGLNQSSTTMSNATQFGGNQTTAPSPSPEEQRNALVRSFIDNVTSGDSKVIVITESNQPGVPEQQQARDVDPLGLINFTGDEGTMKIVQPENATTSLGGTSDSTLTLYAGGQMTFMFENLSIEPPVDIDVILLSKDGDELRFPTVVDNTGLDAEFVIPEGLADGKSYLVLLGISWADLQQDILMGLDGRAVANTQ